MGRPQGTCKVLVSRIQSSTDKKEIHSLLSTFGNIISYEVRPNQDKDRSGYYRLLVTFEATEQAQQAVRNLSNYRYAGSVLRLEYYNPNYGDMNGGPHPHHNKRHNGHMGGRGNVGMPNGGHAGGHGGHHGARGGGSMMNGGHMNGSLRSPMGGPGYYSGHVGPLPPKELPVRMLVPSDMVGAIIGKSGATITSITQQSQARVEVNKKNAGGIYADGLVDKVINIYGANEACSQACKRILEVMLQESQQPAANTMNGGGASRRRDEPITLRLLAHNNLVGRVIGRSGIVIKKIMEETNAKINVSQMTDPRERVIVIKGNLEEMCKAQQQITSKMRQCYEQDLQQAMMGGYGGPDMGPPPPQPIPPALSYAFHRPPLPPPLPHSYHGGPNGHHGGPHHPSNFGPPVPYGHLGMSSPPGHYYPMGDGSVEVVHVWVPSCTVGAIIGTGGLSIREMIRASGCSIKVSQTNAKDESRTKVDESAQPKQNGSENSVETPSSSSAATEGSQSTKREGGNVTSFPNPSDRRVTVTGTAEAQWKAQCLLFRKVFLEAVQHLDLNPDVANDPQIRMGHLRVEINVPSSQVGRIIGKGGSTVKDMQRQSGAIIKLPEETSRRAGSPDEAVETPLYIIGDFYATQAAQRRIHALIARNSQGGPTANGSNAKKPVDETATQKVEGDCDQSESQC